MPALNFRVFVGPVLIAVLATGCAQQRSLATTAEQDCYRRFSGESYKYTLLGISAPSPMSIALAVIRAEEDQRKTAFKAALKTLGEPATASLPVEAELAKAEAELTREKAEAGAMNRKLDEIEARVEAGKAQMGECFGYGYYGKQAAENYTRDKKDIADKRKYVARGLDRVLEKHRVAAKRAAFVERWRADNALHLKRRAGNADLEIVEVARLGSFGRVSLRVTVAITNTTSSTILRPRNWPVWGHGGSIELGRSVPIGISTTDSFDNFYKVARVKQSWATGIRPGERIFYELEYAEMPLEDTKFIRIILAYEQDQWAVFDIPAEVFFGGLVKP